MNFEYLMPGQVLGHTLSIHEVGDRNGMDAVGLGNVGVKDSIGSGRRS